MATTNELAAGAAGAPFSGAKGRPGGPGQVTHFIGFQALFGLEVTFRDGVGPDLATVSRMAVVWGERLTEAFAEWAEAAGDAPVRVVRVHREGNAVKGIRRVEPGAEPPGHAA